LPDDRQRCCGVSSRGNIQVWVISKTDRSSAELERPARKFIGEIMASRKAQAVSVSKLISSIDKAVAQAARKQGVALGGETLINRWEVIGRVLREHIDMNDAFALAKEVTQTANLQGLKADPVASRVGGDILIGFVARANLPSFGS
jgi:hypothetical protein